MNFEIQLAEKDLEILKKEREILKLKLNDNLKLNDKLHGYIFKGICNNKQSKHYEKTGMECAESIINQKGWDFDKLLNWVKSHSQGVFYEKENDKKTLGWTIIKDADTYTHKFVEKNKSLEKCKSICQEKNYGGFTFCVHKDTMKPYGGGHMFNKTPNEGIENMMKTDTEAYFKLNPGVKQFNAELYICPGASLELLKNKEKEGFDIKYDELDI